uniref:Secreted protein n=1 Tax=Steinernema glaseri TaxID=37863 RepID=A0A1I7ZPD8_9BILA
MLVFMKLSGFSCPYCSTRARFVHITVITLIRVTEATTSSPTKVPKESVTQPSEKGSTDSPMFEVLKRMQLPFAHIGFG